MPFVLSADVRRHPPLVRLPNMSVQLRNPGLALTPPPLGVLSVEAKAHVSRQE
jgi:hypothetical protein